MSARNDDVPAFAAYSPLVPAKWKHRAAASAGLVAAFSAVVLLEWVFGLNWLTSAMQGDRAPNPMVALCFLLAASSIWLLRSEAPRSAQLQIVLAGLVALIAMLRLLELAGVGISVDLWLSLTDAARSRTGRMVPRTALVQLLLGVALLLLHFRGRLPALLGQCALIELLGLTTLTMLEYVYDIRAASPTSAGMALSTALGATTLALGAFMMTADRGLAPILSNSTSGATFARRLLFAIVLGTAILGYMRLAAARHGLVETPAQSVAVIVTVGMITLVALLLWNASVQARAEMISAHLATIVRDSAAGIASATVDGRILTWNEAAERIYGYSAEEVIGKSISILPVPEERGELMAAVKRIAEGESSIKLEGTRLARDGRRILLSMRLSPIHASDGRILAIASVFEDITTDRKQRSELEQARKLASVGKLAGGVAYHLNNALTVVIGHADLTRELLGEEHEAIAEVDAIRAGARDAARIVQMLMGAAGARSLASEAIDLSALILQHSHELAAKLSEPERLIILADECPRVQGDEAAIVEAIHAVLENAVEASAPGREIVIRTRPLGDGRVVLEVIDFGAGMDADTRRQALDPFFTTKGLAVSAGMGLAMAQGTMRRLGGSIEIDSTPGNGTTVRLIFLNAEAK